MPLGPAFGSSLGSGALLLAATVDEDDPPAALLGAHLCEQALLWKALLLGDLLWTVAGGPMVPSSVSLELSWLELSLVSGCVRLKWDLGPSEQSL